MTLGFLVTGCAGVAVHLRGRGAGTGVLAVGAVVLVLVAATLGREAVSEFMVGTLLGMPAMSGALVAKERRERNAQ
jgi:hypothetical protein